ncbi:MULTISPECIES: XRE family transcriptional regulator [Halomonadaceae]|uniref:XRE family transcriptional regulator n=1 Tax=Halomonadaceae TaxID=28256 RepID=UPI0015980EA2|nr:MULTISPECIES: XRE family transcriptional regulator [Halomonas]QJQ95964.1 XRE family transcriptional regulator [Halomonas sp. PA5]
MSTARLTTGWDFRTPPRLTPDLDVRELEKRSRLMRVVTRRIALSELPNREIAQRAGIPPQRLSDLLAGKIEQFSVEELELLRDSVEEEG